MVGKGPSPVAGSVRSTSSGTPSQVGTRSASVVVGQKRTPLCATQACPKGVISATALLAARARRRTANARMDDTLSEPVRHAEADQVHHGRGVGTEAIARLERCSRIEGAIALERGLLHEAVQEAEGRFDRVAQTIGRSDAEQVAVGVRDAGVAEAVAGGRLVVLEAPAEPQAVDDLPLDPSGEREGVVEVLRIDDRWLAVVRHHADLLEAAPAEPVHL